MTTGIVAEIRGAYDRAASAWLVGPDAVYEQMAVPTPGGPCASPVAIVRPER